MLYLDKAGYPLFVVCEGRGEDAAYTEHVVEEERRGQEEAADLTGTEEFLGLSCRLNARIFLLDTGIERVSAYRSR